MQTLQILQFPNITYLRSGISEDKRYIRGVTNHEIALHRIGDRDVQSCDWVHSSSYVCP